MSSNTVTISDEDGTYADWIEIVNIGDQAINLQGYGLSDDYFEPFKWVFPDYEFEPGEFIVVWASGKDRKIINGNLRYHTNFAINAEGEVILLTNPNGELIDVMLPVEIPSDISYGRVPDGIGSWYFFESATPGTPNTTEFYSGITSKPEFSPIGGVYGSPLNLTIGTLSEGAEIYYSTNGDIPTQLSSKYSGPLELHSTTKIIASAKRDNEIMSDVASSGYLITNNNVIDFSSNLPIMIIQDIGTSITADNRTDAYIHIINDEKEYINEITQIPDFEGRIAINKRGFSSLFFPKNNYGFHILEEDGSNRKVSLLGLPEEHNWVLHGPYSDKTLMRNAFSYGLSNEIGQYAPHTRFVELFMHTGAGSLDKEHYYGVYLLTQRIKIAPGNVNIQELEPYHNHYPEITGGYIYKIDRLNPGETGFKTSRNTHFAFVRPNEAAITSAQKEYLVSYLDKFEQALFSDDFQDPINGYAAYIDVESFIDIHLLTEVTKEIDGYFLSTFFYKDRGGKIVSGPLWDFNLSLGNASYRDGWNYTGWYFNTLDDKHYLNGWYTRLFEDEAFKKRYEQRYRSLRNGKLSNAYLKNKILSYYSLLYEAQARNFDRWDVLGHHIWPNWFVGETYENEVYWMIDWLEKRLEWIDGQLGSPYCLIHYWNFNNDYELLNPTYTLGGGEIILSINSNSEVLSGSGQGFLGINARNNDEAANHLRINNPIGTEIVLKIPSTNYKDLLFSYETRRSGSGANRQSISYTINGNDYTPLGEIIVTEYPEHYQFSLSDIEQTANNSKLAIKIQFEYDTDYEGGTEGNNRIDNITLEGEPHNEVVQPPVQMSILPDIYKLIENGVGLSIPMRSYFSHPQNKVLTFSVELHKGDIINAYFENNNLILEPVSRGGTHIDIFIEDGTNPPLKASLYCIVYPEAFNFREGQFSFNYWSREEPEGKFPENMIFLQSQENDPSITTDMHHAYYIPEDDYAENDLDNIGYPYKNQSRTRITGLEKNGISFINTGRDRDLGSVLLAINTRKLYKIFCSWEASTLQANSRSYNIRLQYRIGYDGYWKNWKDSAGNKIEYKRNPAERVTKKFTDLELPNDATDNDYVQIRWVYYYSDGEDNSGARDMLAIHNIELKTESVIEHDRNMISLFPNPVTKGILNFYDKTSGTIYNSSGIKIMSFENKYEIYVGSLASGIYIVRATNGAVGKFVVHNQK